MRQAQHVPACGAGRRWSRRAVIALSVVAGFAVASVDAQAFTLTLAFPDGQPMSYGSACAGRGCLQRNDGVDRTDDQGRVFLPDRPRTIEYRRDGIDLGLLGTGLASGSLLAIGDAATVTLPRLLIGSAPSVDAVESDLVARLNEVRAAQGLPLAQVNAKLATAADYQATWLTQSGATVLQPDRFHVGPFGTDLGFRHGEASLPDAGSGGEIAEAGGTIDETVSDWLASPEHRSLVLTPGPMLIGAGRVGSFIIVETHKPCAACEQSGTGSRTNPPPPPPVAVTAGSSEPSPPPPPPPAAEAAATPPRPSCGHEHMAARRLANRGGRVRLRIAMHCLRPRMRYVLLVREGMTGRLLRTMRIKSAATMTLRLRPARTARSLRIKLKRNGLAIAARTLKLGTS